MATRLPPRDSKGRFRRLLPDGRFARIKRKSPRRHKPGERIAAQFREIRARGTVGPPPRDKRGRFLPRSIRWAMRQLAGRFEAELYDSAAPDGRLYAVDFDSVDLGDVMAEMMDIRDGLDGPIPGRRTLISAEITIHDSDGDDIFPHIFTMLSHGLRGTVSWSQAIGEMRKMLQRYYAITIHQIFAREWKRQ